MLYRNFKSQAEIDQQYDPLLGKDRGAVLARYQEQSEQTRHEIGNWARLSYGPTKAEYLDIFPAEETGGPLHIFIHGGYWRACSSHEFAMVATQLVPAGITTLVINYELCPAVSMAEIVRQARSAVAWAWDNADRLGYDRNQITVSGHSAGGHLVGMLLATDWEGQYGLPSNIIKGAIPISGLYDLGPFPHSWLQPDLQLEARDVERLSPIMLQPGRPVPVRIRLGALESDEFHRQSHEYGHFLAEQGFDIEVAAIPDADHYSVLDHFREPGGWLVDDVLALSRG